MFDNELLQELWKIYKLQNMFSFETMFPYIDDLVTKYFTDKYNLENSNSEFIYLLDELYKTLEKAPTVKELLAKCEEAEIVIKEES